MAVFAGQFGPYPFIDLHGDALPGVEVAVWDLAETTLATLYEDRAKTDTLANPIPIGVSNGEAGVDRHGNAIFYADAGQYLMIVSVLGVERYRSPVTIPADPTDANAVASVNGRSGIVVGLAEQADLLAEATTRGDDDAALSGRLDTLELDPITATEVANDISALSGTFVTDAEHGSTVGNASLDGSDLVVDVTTHWGIGVDGPYYEDDPADVTAGEEALFSIDPDGAAGWILVSEVH